MKKSMKFTLLKTVLPILCLLIQYKSIGQKDTTIVKNNDSLVITTKQTAVFIVKDLLKLDIVQKENEYLKQDTSLLQKQISLYKKDSATYKLMEKGYIGAIGNYQKSLDNCEQYARKKDKELARTKFKSVVSQVFFRHFGYIYNHKTLIYGISFSRTSY
jgi:cell division protein FtsB